MKWEDRRRSTNVRKGPSVNSGGSVGGNGYNRNRGGFNTGRGGYRGPIIIPSGRRRGRGRGGISSILILFLVLFLMKNFMNLGSSVNYDNGVNQNPGYQQQTQPSSTTGTRATREDFLAVVLADTEDVWHEVFNEQGMSYREPTMVPFQGSTRSACGVANSQMGPFYCPNDQSIYIDVGFYDDLVNNFGGGGDFAFAYVLAHEVGHHVQNQLGILEQTNKLRRTLSTKEYNRISVAQELQADYFAGLFAAYVEDKDYLDPGDIEEAMRAAAAIGDDRIQEMSGRSVNVDTFTHGSSEQRKEAFNLGYKYRDIDHSMIFFDRLNQ